MNNKERAELAVKSLEQMSRPAYRIQRPQNPAEVIAQAINYFANDTGTKDEDGATKLSDLLCDLSHACQLFDKDFDSFARVSGQRKFINLDNQKFLYFIKYAPLWADQNDSNFDDCRLRALIHFYNGISEEELACTEVFN